MSAPFALLLFYPPTLMLKVYGTTAWGSHKARPRHSPQRHADPCILAPNPQRKHEELVAGLELQQYEIAGNEDAWDAALSSQNRVSTPSMISVKSGNKDKKQKAPASAPAKSKHQAKRPKHKH